MENSEPFLSGAAAAQRWADDVDTGAPGGPAGEYAQDFDDQLAAEERHWEATSVARNLPPGWAKCPNAGTAVFGLTPIKAPIGKRAGQGIPAPYQWKPSDAIEHMHAKGVRVGAVVDLTMTERYYDAAEFLGAPRIKIRCKGHGEVPRPADVNAFVWAVHSRALLLQQQWQADVEFLRKYDEDVRAHEKQAAESGGGADGAVQPAAPPYQRLAPSLRRIVDERELVARAPAAIIVHCTHGYNRSGYMTVHYAKRLSPNTPVADCIRSFREARPPGIYKDDYIQALFDYYHENRPDEGPGAVDTPLVPVWKADDGSPEHVAAAETEDAAAGPGDTATVKHDDKIGEDVCVEEAQMYQREVIEQVRNTWLDRHAGSMGEAELRRRRSMVRPEFPGSQPVSLSSENQSLVCKKRYWFTWKADGTRYMLYVSHSGAFLIDRRMVVTRAQLRFPAWSHAGIPDGSTNEWLSAFLAGRLPKATLHKARMAFHHATLVEGEMVVDRQPDGRLEFVFYVYDLMMLNGANVTVYPWKASALRVRAPNPALDPWCRPGIHTSARRTQQRYMLIRELVDPRKFEQSLIANPAVSWPHRYQYSAEPFRVVCKTFWPLHALPRVRQVDIPQLRHEHDGLILQGYESQYQPGPCHELLKWKPASHNSVDFKLLHATDELVILDDRCSARIQADGQDYFLGVLERGRVTVAFDFDDDLQISSASPPARVAFPPDTDPATLVDVIIECNFDQTTGCWLFMRDRSKDKETPNALDTYRKVVLSIRSAIDEGEISDQFHIAYQVNKADYAKDIAAAQHAASGKVAGAKRKRV